jgi:hypothetical protein
MTEETSQGGTPTLHRVHYAPGRSGPCRCLIGADHTLHDDEPSLGYAGTSGHQQAATSRDAILDDDLNGVTAAAQRYVLVMARQRHAQGVTVAELRESKGGLHHGKMSSALTNLHKAGRLVALKARRDKCGIYVLPEFVEDREVRSYRPNKTKVDPEIIVGVMLAHPQTLPLQGNRSFLWHCGCGWASRDQEFKRHLAGKIAEALDA